MLATILLTAALVTPTPEPPFQPNRAQLIASASGMAKYKPVLGPMIARAMLVDVVTSAGPRTSGGLGSGGLVGGDLYLADLIDINLASTGVIRWSATTDPTATKDLGFSRPSAGLVRVTNGGTGVGGLEAGKLTLTYLGTPATPVITQGGAAGATAYSYKVVAKLPDTTTTEASTAGSTAAGNAVLDGTNYNIVTWAATTNAHCYDVWRTVGGATQGKILTCVTSPQNDTGIAGVGAGTEPILNSTGMVSGIRTARGAGAGSIVISGGSSTGTYGAAAAGTTATAIGMGTTAAGNDSIAIGRSASSGGLNSIVLGLSSSASSDNGIVLGYNSSALGLSSVAIGNANSSPATSDYTITIGNTATVGADSDNSIALGVLATVPASMQGTFVAGHDAYPISNLYFGDGVTSATPTAYTINGGGASGSNIVGGDLQLAPGISTGLAVPGKVKIRNTRVIGTGNTPQTLADLAYFGDVAADGSTNFFNVTGTMPSTSSGVMVGHFIDITSANAASTVQWSGFYRLNAGYVGAAQTASLYAQNAVAGTGTALASHAATYGIVGETIGASTGTRVGVYGKHVTGATTGRAIGVLGYSADGTTQYGTAGFADADGTNAAGGIFWLGTTEPTPGGTAVLVADNVAVAQQIFSARDNGTATWTIEDNGAVWAKTGTKTLVSATPTEFVRITMAATGHQGGICEYCVQANDGSNQQVRCGSIPFTFINESSTEACTVGTTSDSDGTPTGTLTAAITAASASNNTCGLLANADSSLAETTLQINYHIRLLGNAATAVVPQ